MSKHRKNVDDGLPKEWRTKPSFNAYMAWLTNDLKKRNFEDTTEDFDHKGWWLYLPVVNALEGMADSQVQALQIIKNAILEWKLEGSHDKAPVQLPSQELKALWERFRQAKLDPPQGDYVYNLFEIHGDFALKAVIEVFMLADEFTTTFGAANNPVRSLEAKHCRLHDNFSEEEKVLGEGYPKLEGNRLTIGEWSGEFDPSLEVWGSAYSEASWEDEHNGYWLIATSKNNEE